MTMTKSEHRKTVRDILEQWNELPLAADTEGFEQLELLDEKMEAWWEKLKRAIDAMWADEDANR